MNDSPYGLTASVWTNAQANAQSEAAFLTIADELSTGTVFLNRSALGVRQLRALLTVSSVPVC